MLPSAFELVIGEDCSSDGTREIVKRVRRAPSGASIRAVLPERNVGHGEIFRRALEATRGRVHRLSRRRRLLDLAGEAAHARSTSSKRNPDCASCFHDVSLVYDEARHALRARSVPGLSEERFSLEDILAGLLRAGAGGDVPPRGRPTGCRRWAFDVGWIDWLIHICAATLGPIGYIPQPLAAYRVHQGGMFSALDRISQLEEDLPFYERLLRRAARAAGADRALRRLPTLPARDRAARRSLRRLRRPDRPAPRDEALLQWPPRPQPAAPRDARGHRARGDPRRGRDTFAPPIAITAPPVRAGRRPRPATSSCPPRRRSGSRGTDSSPSTSRSTAGWPGRTSRCTVHELAAAGRRGRRRERRAPPRRVDLVDAGAAARAARRRPSWRHRPRARCCRRTRSRSAAGCWDATPVIAIEFETGGRAALAVAGEHASAPMCSEAFLEQQVMAPGFPDDAERAGAAGRIDVDAYSPSCRRHAPARCRARALDDR